MERRLTPDGRRAAGGSDSEQRSGGERRVQPDRRTGEGDEGVRLRVQDEERRRIARDLHDSTSPLLTALIANLYWLKERATESPASVLRTVEESLRLAEACSGMIRTVAYLRHPPLLEKRGLVAALRWLLNGLATQTDIRVEMDFATDVPRLERDAEIALYRVAQDSLANVLRLSGKPSVQVRVGVDAADMTLEIRGAARGNAADGQVDAGIPGLRERLRRLGGGLDVSAAGKGIVVVRATLPLAPATAPQQEFRP